MAKNDVVLLDSLIEKARAQFAVSDDSELFELFSFDQLLKQHEPSIDEIESGWSDGGNAEGQAGRHPRAVPACHHFRDGELEILTHVRLRLTPLLYVLVGRSAF
jgi:hypothetical protein